MTSGSPDPRVAKEIMEECIRRRKEQGIPEKDRPEVDCEAFKAQSCAILWAWDAGFTKGRNPCYTCEKNPERIKNI